MKRFIEFIKNYFKNKNKCDHIYFPYYDQTIDRKFPIGQQCALCKKFNSNEQLGIDFYRVPDWRTNGKTYIKR